MKVVQFQGRNKAPSAPIFLPPVDHYDLTPSPDVPLAILKRKLLASNNNYEMKVILDEMGKHLQVRMNLYR